MKVLSRSLTFERRVDCQGVTDGGDLDYISASGDGEKWKREEALAEFTDGQAVKGKRTNGIKNSS